MIFRRLENGQFLAEINTDRCLSDVVQIVPAFRFNIFLDGFRQFSGGAGGLGKGGNLIDARLHHVRKRIFRSDQNDPLIHDIVEFREFARD